MVIRCLISIGLIVALASPSASAWMFYDQRKTDFGASFESAKSGQILNPDAGKNLEPVSGFDGQAARVTVEKYREGFQRPAPRTVHSISIGGIGQK